MKKGRNKRNERISQIKGKRARRKIINKHVFLNQVKYTMNYEKKTRLQKYQLLR